MNSKGRYKKYSIDSLNSFKATSNSLTEIETYLPRETSQRRYKTSGLQSKNALFLTLL
jgi:hypothetical protein